MWVNIHKGSQHHCVFSIYINVSSFLHTWWAWVCRDVLSTGGFQWCLATKPCMLTRKYSSPPQKLLLPVLHSSSALWVFLRWELGTGRRESKLPTELRSMQEEGGRDKREFWGTQQGIDIKGDPFKEQSAWVVEPLSHKLGNMGQREVMDRVVDADTVLRLRPEIKTMLRQAGNQCLCLWGPPMNPFPAWADSTTQWLLP